MRIRNCSFNNNQSYIIARQKNGGGKGDRSGASEISRFEIWIKESCHAELAGSYWFSYFGRTDLLAGILYNVPEVYQMRNVEVTILYKNIDTSTYYDEYLSTTMRLFFTNGLTSKSFFRMLVGKNIEWTFDSGGKGQKRNGRGNGRERKKFTVGHARGVKSTTKNLCSCLCPGMVKWTPPLFVRRDGGKHEAKRSIDKLRVVVDLQSFVAVTYET